VLVGFCLAILVHFSEINTVIDYAPSIFRAAGWQIDAALFSTFVVGLTNFSLTIVSFWIIDRYGAGLFTWLDLRAWQPRSPA